MSSSSTSNTSISTPSGPWEWLDAETTRSLMEILMYCVTPIISTIGVGGNILSMLVLRKHGLHKSSNILLFALAITDIVFLVSFNSVPKILYEMTGDGYFNYGENVSRVLFVFFILSFLLDYTSGFSGVTLPMLITTERLVAVFLPLQFSKIVTPFRTWVGVCSIWLFYMSYYVSCSFNFRLVYAFDTSLNKSVGRMTNSFLYELYEPDLPVLEKIITGTTVQPVYTLIGCIIIIVKVKFIALNRRKMTNYSKSSSTSKTTKMILAVCAVYLLTCFFAAVNVYFPENLMTSEDVKASGMAKLVYQAINIVACINGSSNFIVYIAMNEKFRRTLKEMLRLA